jgi:hypothetical protein
MGGCIRPSRPLHYGVAHPRLSSCFVTLWRTTWIFGRCWSERFTLMKIGCLTCFFHREGPNPWSIGKSSVRPQIVQLWYNQEERGL